MSANLTDQEATIIGQVAVLTVPSRERLFVFSATHFFTAVCTFARKQEDDTTEKWSLVQDIFFRGGDFDVFFMDADGDGRQDVLLTVTNHPGTGMFDSTMYILVTRDAGLKEVASIDMGNNGGGTMRTRPSVSAYWHNGQRILEVTTPRLEEFVWMKDKHELEVTPSRREVFIWKGDKFKSVEKVQ